MKKLLITLLILTSLSVANTQVSKIPNAEQQFSKWANDPQNKNDNLLNPQTQNETELMMFLLKSIEDKNITDKQKKIEFVNSFKVSEDIKQYAISLINQNITYSNNEKISYGIYSLKQCNDKPKTNACIVDYRPNQGCKPERSNVCCP